MPLARLRPHTPALLHDALRTSRFYARRADALVFAADGSRRQAENADDCFARLWRCLLDAVDRVVPGDTAPEQRERVRKL